LSPESSSPGMHRSPGTERTFLNQVPGSALNWQLGLLSFRAAHKKFMSTEEGSRLQGASVIFDLFTWCSLTIWCRSAMFRVLCQATRLQEKSLGLDSEDLASCPQVSHCAQTVSSSLSANNDSFLPSHQGLHPRLSRDGYHLISTSPFC